MIILIAGATHTGKTRLAQQADGKIQNTVFLDWTI